MLAIASAACIISGVTGVPTWKPALQRDTAGLRQLKTHDHYNLGNQTITGKCAGNTKSSEDVICPAEFVRIENKTGTDVAACCERCMPMTFVDSVATCTACSGDGSDKKCTAAVCAVGYESYNAATQTCSKQAAGSSEVTASIAISGAVDSQTFLAQVQKEMPEGSKVEIESFKMTAEAKTGGIPGTPADFGTPAAPTAQLIQFKDGLAGVFDGVSTTDIEIKTITQEASSGRRRLQSNSVEIDYAITSADPTAASSMAAKISNTTAFKTALATSVNAAGTAAGTGLSLDSSKLASAATLKTEVKVKVVVPPGKSADAATSTLKDPAKMATVANSAAVAGTPAITAVSATATVAAGPTQTLRPKDAAAGVAGLSSSIALAVLAIMTL